MAASVVYVTFALYVDFLLTYIIVYSTFCAWLCSTPLWLVQVSAISFLYSSFMLSDPPHTTLTECYRDICHTFYIHLPRTIQLTHIDTLIPLLIPHSFLSPYLLAVH